MTQIVLNLELDNMLLKSVIYKATVKVPNKADKHYYGLSEPTFKKRYDGHTHTFRHRDARQTQLSNYIWKLKDANTEYDIKWSIAKKAAPYRCGTRRCDLCLAEKVTIAAANQRSLLNTRAEVVSNCRHRWKFTYEKINDND